MWMGSHLLMTHIFPEQKKEKTSIHSQESTSTFLARFLTSWQNEDSLIWYMAIKILLSQQSITNYILKNGYTLFHNALIMARWWLNYEKMASLCQYVGCLNVWQIMNRETKVVQKARHPKHSIHTLANLQSNVNEICNVLPSSGAECDTLPYYWTYGKNVLHMTQQYTYRKDENDVPTASVSHWCM